MLGILAWAVVWWVVRVLPELVVAIVMAVLFVVAAAVPINTVFSMFADSTWWLLLAAFGIGVGMERSGLVRRIVLALIGACPPRFGAQAAALMAAGTVVGPFFPSMAAKLAILEPIAFGVSDSMGFERKGREASGLFLATFVGVRNLGPAVVSASVIGYAIVGLMPSDVQESLTMASWFLAALPWFAIVTALNYVAIMALYAPRRDEVSRQKGAAAAAAIADARRELGPMGLSEKRMLVIVVATVALWASEPVHGLPSAAVALSALAATLIAGVCDLQGLTEGMNWGSLLFIGIAMGLSPVFAAVGIDDWVIGLVGPIISRLAFSPYAFMLGIGVATILIRFVIVSEMAYVNIFMASAVPMAVSLGINPWIVGFAVYATVNP